MNLVHKDNAPSMGVSVQPDMGWRSERTY
jgi:hypothetical protein